MSELPRGTFIVGNGWYGRCPDCEQIVRLNKFIIGSLHICLTDEERAYKRHAQQRIIAQQQARPPITGLGNLPGY